MCRVSAGVILVHGWITNATPTPHPLPPTEVGQISKYASVPRAQPNWAMNGLLRLIYGTGL